MNQNISVTNYPNTCQMICSSKRRALDQSPNDLNVHLRIAFEFWIDALRIASDLSMQVEHIDHFVGIYEQLMSADEHLFYARIQKKIRKTCEKAEQYAEQKEKKMTHYLQNFFHLSDNGHDFYGGTAAYEQLHTLWEDGTLIPKIKETIFVTDLTGDNSIHEILQAMTQQTENIPSSNIAR